MATHENSKLKMYTAEFFGTFWLVLGGCGSAVLAAGFPELGIGFLGVALAFGLTVLTMGYAIGHISGFHLNPAVSIGLWAGGRFPARHLLPYIIAQVIGAIAAGGILYIIATGKAGFNINEVLRNGYGEHSPGGSLAACLLTEIVMTAMFLLIILGLRRTRASGFARGDRAWFELIHLISIRDQHLSQPARSTGVAACSGWAMHSCGCSGWRRLRAE